jgi:hypothetical protein
MKQVANRTGKGLARGDRDRPLLVHQLADTVRPHHHLRRRPRRPAVKETVPEAVRNTTSETVGRQCTRRDGEGDAVGDTVRKTVREDNSGQGVSHTSKAGSGLSMLCEAVACSSLGAEPASAIASANCAPLAAAAA